MLSILCFTGAACVLLYVLAGYPLLLDRIARRSNRVVRKDTQLRSVSIVIAVWNGEKFLADKLDSLFQLDYPRELLQIIVVSDGSDDGTDEIGRAYQKYGVEFLRLPRGGKGAAVNAGAARARNEILVLTDVRQLLDRESVRNLVSCFGDPEVGVVSGELSILPGESHAEADTGLYWKYEMWMRRRMSRVDSTFGANGPFYAMRRELVVPIPEKTLLDDVYLPFAAFFRGYRIVLEPGARAFDYPTSLESEFRRKVRTQAGLYQLLRFYPQLLSSRNRMRWHFLSGKFGRLTLPFLLVVIAVSSFGLPGFWAPLMLGGQAVFYLAALLDLIVPEGSPLKRFTSPPRTFTVLMFAALISVRVFFVEPRHLWKHTSVRKVEAKIEAGVGSENR